MTDGSVKITMSYTPPMDCSNMPEFGLLFEMDPAFDCCCWYGMGPEETYCDRQTGAKLGVYQNRVGDNYSRYLRPQECGNHTGVRWAKITDENDFGLKFEADQTMDFSALGYTPHELENAAHQYELPRTFKTVVRTSMKQIGVGGDNTWGACTHVPYRIQAPEGALMHFSVILRPIKN